MRIRRQGKVRAQKVHTMPSEKAQTHNARNMAQQANRQYMSTVLRPITLKHFHLRLMPAGVVLLIVAAFCAGWYGRSETNSLTTLRHLLAEHWKLEAVIVFGYILVAFGTYLTVHGKALFSGEANSHGRGLFDANDEGHGYKDVSLENVFRITIQICTGSVFVLTGVLLGWYIWYKPDYGMVFATLSASVVGIVIAMLFLWKDLAEFIFNRPMKMRVLLFHIVTLGVFKGSLLRLLVLFKRTMPQRQMRPQKIPSGGLQADVEM